MLSIRWDKTHNGSERGKILRHISVLLLFIFAFPLWSQPEFRVRPNYLENDIRGMFAARDTLIITNNGDQRLEWSVEIRLHGNPADTAWITLSRTNGQVDAGGRQFVVVTMRGRNLADGHYYADLFFTSNDPHRQEWTVPCAGHKAIFPRIEAVWQVPQQGEWWGIDMNRILGDIYWGRTYSFQLTIRNRGSDTLRVDTLICQNAYFQITPSQFNLPPNSNRQVAVALEAVEVGANSTIVTSQSNVWDPAELNFRIVATVLPVFRMGTPIPDTTFSEDSGEHLIADLDTVFISSYPNTTFRITGGTGTRWRLHRNNEFFITPLPNWNGATTYFITASADTLSLTDTFQVTITPVPDPPEPFDLYLPEDEDTLWYDRGDSLFLWQSTNDPDGDTVIFTVEVWISDSDTLRWTDITDTFLSTKDLYFNDTLEGWVNWTVKATGGGLTRSAWSVFSLYLPSGRQETKLPPDALPTNFTVTLFPNPTNHTLSIWVIAPKSELITLELRDLQGRLVGNWGPYHLKGGRNTLSLPFLTLPTNCYWLTIKTSDQYLGTRQIILMR